MPSNVRRFYTSIFLALFSFTFLASAQSPTSGDVMRDRISKAKAFIAVRNYNAAIYELENIRRETGDASVQAVVNVLLMNSYLEQGDYKRAQDFLSEFYTIQKTTKPNAQANYFAVAGQIVKGARNRIERYRALGLSVSDRTLPLEASSDIEKMRDTLELVITQSKEIGKEKSKTPNAMALLEEAANSRSMMARDDYDARRWRDEVGDAREQITSSRSVVINAVNDGSGETVPQQNLIASTTPQNTDTAAILPAVLPGTSSGKQVDISPAFKPAANVPTNAVEQSKADLESKNAVAAGTKDEVKKAEEKTAVKDKSVKTDDPRPRIAENGTDPSEQKQVSQSNDNAQPVAVGSLLDYATKQTQPIYPAVAKSMRATGVVKVEVTVDESGDVSEVQKATGPALLQTAAKDAIRKWKFRPFVRDGQAVKATGFVNFNFSL